uniref:Uncharacterized protein n=1 Tax=Plectus sambesii TaxID=2011161 RepID=A0A914XEB1_9BILA
MSLTWVLLLINVSCFYQLLLCEIPPDCLPDDSDAEAKELELISASTSGAANSRILAFATSMLQGFALAADMSDNTRACQYATLLRMDEQFERILLRITALENNIILKLSKREALNLFQKNRRLNELFTKYRTLKRSKTLKKLKKRCEEHDPSETLANFADYALEAPQIFMEIVTGVNYNEPEFNLTTASIVADVALCSLLAAKCLKLVAADDEEISYQLNVTLTKQLIIQDGYFNALAELRSGFPKAVRHALGIALEEVTNKPLTRFKGAEFVYHKMTEGYPFRAWSVIMYDLVTTNEIEFYNFIGTREHYHVLSNSRHTMIVHSSDKKRNCEDFGKIFHGKNLSDLFLDQEKYRAVVESERNFYPALEYLQEMLQSYNLTNEFFIGLLRYKSSQKIASDTAYHYIEHLKYPDRNLIAKTVIIGWC